MESSENKTFLALRTNIRLDGDIKLAREEVKSIYQETNDVKTLEDLPQSWKWALQHIGNNIRMTPPIGFLCDMPKMNIDDIVRKLSFIQEIWFDNANDFKIDRCWLGQICDGTSKIYYAIPLMATSEILTKMGKHKYQRDFSRLVVHEALNLINHNSTQKKLRFHGNNIVENGCTSTPHVHGLHKYKAKFFPRMIRSFINSVKDSIPNKADDQLTVLDPFVGSGTTLIESSLLGFPSWGLDIDPLCCLISKAKIFLLNCPPNIVDVACSTLLTEHSTHSFSVPTGYDKQRYFFPRWIARKFEQRNDIERMRYYEHEIQLWLNAILRFEDVDLRELFLVCLSDCLTRKFNMRMMGTGVGRFALEIIEKPISKMMCENINYLRICVRVCEEIKRGYGLQLPKATVLHGDATKMPFEDDFVELILTSPPYLPASSGRENYLMGKSISLTALGLLTEQEIEKYDGECMGSMKASNDNTSIEIPDEAYNLVNWLAKDPLRAIKAEPIRKYYQNLAIALEDSYRVLKPKGVAIWIIGKESVFYRFKTREILRRVMCDRIFTQLAENVGFEVVKQVDVQLDKRNKNARPRSMDAYYEAAIFLVKE